MPNEVGRPRVQLSDLPERWRDIMHAIYSVGGSDAEVKVAMAIGESRAMSNTLWDDLRGREPEFSEAVMEGQQLAHAWWESKGREGLFTYEGMKFSSSLWFLNMKNRFGWRDKQEVQHGSDPNNPMPSTVIYLPANGRETK